MLYNREIVEIKKVSVCIPVFHSENYLDNCLQSLSNQSFRDFEVVIVNDGSKGIDSKGQSCKNIVSSFSSNNEIKVKYIEYNENKGLLEARRRAIYESEGEYILNLDSDDKLSYNALEVLYNKAIETEADIVHGKGELFWVNNEGNREEPKIDVFEQKKIKIQKVSNVYHGTLENSKILDGFLVDKNHNGFLWGKLFRRTLYLEAFSKIPTMFCTMAEDVMQYFWLSYFAKKYVGIDKVVYFYCDNTGVTSSKVIDSIEKWEHVCSVASVFNGIFNTLSEEEIKLSESQLQRISALSYRYVANNIDQLNRAVISELKGQAYNILCDYWGEDVVLKVEKEMEER